MKRYLRKSTIEPKQIIDSLRRASLIHLCRGTIFSVPNSYKREKEEQRINPGRSRIFHLQQTFTMIWLASSSDI